MVVSSKLYPLIWWWCYVLTPQWARSSIHFNWKITKIERSRLVSRAQSLDLQPKYITIHKTIQSPDRWLVSKSREFRSSTKHSSVCGQICFLLNLFAGSQWRSFPDSWIQTKEISQIVTYPVLDDRSCSHLFSCISLRIWKIGDNDLSTWDLCTNMDFTTNCVAAMSNQ